jgi:hypothetical protein
MFKGVFMPLTALAFRGAVALFGGLLAFAPSAFAQTPCNSTIVREGLAYDFGCVHDGLTGVTMGAVAAGQTSAIIDLQNHILASRNDSKNLAGFGVFPAGRLRRTDHDGYSVEISGGGSDHASSFHAEESSVFGSGFITLPGTTLGGQLQLGGFVGYDDLTLKMGTSNIFGGQFGNSGFGSAASEAFLFGGYGLYTLGAGYAMLTLAGAEGTTDQSQTTNVGGSYSSIIGSSSYDTEGFIGSFVFGRVFELQPANALSDTSGSLNGVKDAAAGASPLKLDVRLGIAYQDFASSQFRDPSGSLLRASLSSWVGSASATVFTQIAMDGGAVWRPYIKSELRQQLSYDNQVDVICGPYVHGPANLKFNQDATMGVGEAGFDYIMPDVTFSAAAYVEEAGDQETIGGRAGLKFKFK